MQLGALTRTRGTTPVRYIPDDGAYALADHGTDGQTDLLSYLAAHQDPTTDRPRPGGRIASPTQAQFSAPYRNPGKILGIGLNYQAHASDLGTAVPERTPASFFKGAHTIIGPGESIAIPAGVGKVTAEAELGLIVGRECYRVPERDALSYVAGVCAILDQTAEDVVRENSRFLTRSKNYPTFFSFGPLIVTLDEILAQFGSLQAIEVATVVNGKEHSRNSVSKMRFGPEYLVSFHSHVMPLMPGDIISTGTPGAAEIASGDQVSCVLDGLMTLTNPVA